MGKSGASSASGHIPIDDVSADSLLLSRRGDVKEKPGPFKRLLQLHLREDRLSESESAGATIFLSFCGSEWVWVRASGRAAEEDATSGLYANRGLLETRSTWD